MVFHQFLKTVFSVEIPIKATDYYTSDSVPSVESIKLMTIIFGKLGKMEEGKNSKLFIKSFVLSVLESNYNSYRLQPF